MTPPDPAPVAPLEPYELGRVRGYIDLHPSALVEASIVARLFAQLDAVTRKLDLVRATFLDKPEDRLYHAADQTWWKREGLHLKQAEPPKVLSTGEPWAYAAVWPGHSLENSDGDKCDRLIFWDYNEADLECAEIIMEEGDTPPRIVPLFPREGEV